MTLIKIPDLCLVVLVGASGSGKTTFAQRHFKPTEILSSDAFRAMISDDEHDPKATEAAFDALHHIIALRLKAGKLTVVDATNVQPHARKPLVSLAKAHDCRAVAVVLDIPEIVCLERNKSRVHPIPAKAIQRQVSDLRRSVRRLEGEGFRQIVRFKSAEEIDATQFDRIVPKMKRLDDRGPFDIIGDIHGCANELHALLTRLGYQNGKHPQGRKAVFVGDLTDRGPDTPQVLGVVMNMVSSGDALCVLGNHDARLLKRLNGESGSTAHGLAETLAQIEGLPEETKIMIREFLAGLPSHYALDGGGLIVAHAGIKPEMVGRISSRIRAFTLYGETTGETDDLGLPVRKNWAEDYRGDAAIVYGHVAVESSAWLNNTVNIDTGCVYGGKLTALRWPEREIVMVPAIEQYYAPLRPFAKPEPIRDYLDIEDVLGRRTIRTQFMPVAIHPGQAAAALEIMARWGVDPRWMVYLPPTMAPVETSNEPGLLEHPNEAFIHYAEEGITEVVCEEKHMGSRAIIVVPRSPDDAITWFGADGLGSCYTRTGRPFFNDPAWEVEVLRRAHQAITNAGMWDELGPWAILDCEITPWSFKAEGLLKRQYAATAAAGGAALARAHEILMNASSRINVAELLSRHADRLTSVRQYANAYRTYCGKVQTLDDITVFPFHVLTQNLRQHHEEHIEIARRMSATDKLFGITPHITVRTDDDAKKRTIRWWRERTDDGGEGIVVKPSKFMSGKAQPALKVRGPEYLRIIYGPEYDLHLDDLRKRAVHAKRNLATKEFVLGVEGLRRFAEREPLSRVHECVFGVLALETEQVDPRL